MATITLSFSSNPASTGVQVGDIAYYIDSTNIASLGGFSTTPSLDSVVKIGDVLGFNGNNLIVNTNLNIDLPTTNDYVFFTKDSSANLNSLVGYFASAKFVNDSTEYAELFSISLGYTESSK